MTDFTLSNEFDIENEQHLIFHVRGMTCAGCAGRAEKALKAVSGVKGATINLALETADVVTLSEPSPATLNKTLEAVGFTTDLNTDEATGSCHLQDEELNAFLTDSRRVGLAALLTLPLIAPMVLGEKFHVPPLVQLGLTIPIVFWFGSQFFRGAWLSIKSG